MADSQRPMTSRRKAAVSKSKRAVEVQQFLAETGSLLTSSLNYETTLSNLAHLAIPFLADWCVVDMLEADNLFHRRAAAHTDPDKSELIDELQQRYPILGLDVQHTLLQVFRSGRSWIDPAISEERLIRQARDTDHVRILRGLGFRSEMVIPLIARGRILGTLTLASGTRSYGPDDLALAEELGRRAALAVENARLYEAEQIARQEAEAAQSRLAFLAEASKVLAASLDYAGTLADVANLMVPRIADWCLVDMLDPGGILRRLAISHSDQAKIVAAWEVTKQNLLLDHNTPAIANVLKTGKPETGVTIPQWDFLESVEDSKNSSSVTQFNESAYLLMPLIARGRALGVLILLQTGSDRRFAQPDIELAHELAQRIATAIENARLYHEAQDALHIRDQFISIAAHELRTPLTTLLGYTQIFQRRATKAGILNERDAYSVQMINTQAKRLNHLIDALLDVARLQQGRFVLERGQVDLCALVSRIVEEMQSTLEKHSIHLQMAQTSLLFEGDGLRLEQVILNLLQNAIKYSPAGGSINVRVFQDSSGICLEIADQGIGIPKAAQRHLFEPFYRAANVDPRQMSGMGIGLYVVNEIVILHGGYVEVESQEGVGSTFRIHLPVMPSRDA